MKRDVHFILLYSNRYSPEAETGFSTVVYQNAFLKKFVWRHFNARSVDGYLTDMQSMTACISPACIRSDMERDVF